VQQHTIADAISCTGVGVHGGAAVRVELEPAPPDHGVVFVRREGGRDVEIPARRDRVVSTRLATTLGRDGARVATVEHLLAAAYGLGVDNLRVVTRGAELPAMDGSAAPFARLLRSAGLVGQGRPRRAMRLRHGVGVRDGDRVARAEPACDLRISYAVEFAHPAVGRQELHELVLDPLRFERELAPARSFGFLEEVAALRRAGLARGGSLANTVVVGERGVLNPEGLRWPDEFVRHKAVDLIGDLALLGARLSAHVHVERGGHALHQRLVAELLARPGAWEQTWPGGASPRRGPAPAAL
jgi:UDP-3-O-[3-hydroxymyristoyl] N-acetylglucosamine deacetylase